MKIPEFKRSRIGLIAEFCGIPNGFPNLHTFTGCMADSMAEAQHHPIVMHYKKINSHVHLH
jgi:hypothetical protein